MVSLRGVSVDVSYLYINDVLEYNPPYNPSYVQSEFTCNLGPTTQKMISNLSCKDPILDRNDIISTI